MQQQLTPAQLATVRELSGGQTMPGLIGGLLDAYDEDAVAARSDVPTLRPCSRSAS